MKLTEEFLKVALFGSEWVMYVLIVCSVISITIIIDRIVYFSKMRGDFGEFIMELTNKLTQKDSFELIAAWSSGKKMLEAQVASAGLLRAKNGPRAAEEAMNAIIISSRTKLDKGLVILATLGNNTPFIGLLGTVIGIIQAFHALSTNTGAGPEVVMASISEALVSTGLGILVAIPAVASYNLIMRSLKKKLANAETVARVVLAHTTSENN